ncbi:hypothetical protein [Anaerosolibacter sp.]|uniref:hypothetical protein n=1 Tax=Anaerosolibacter sp. TaxID=1872527 RepID=UPI0039EF0B5F
MEKLNIFIKDTKDKEIIKNILYAAEIFESKVNFILYSALKEIEVLLEEYPEQELENSVIVSDSENFNIHDSKLKFIQKEGPKKIKIFCANPNIESWVFADDMLVRDEIKESKNGKGIDFLKRSSFFPLPEEIVYPKYVLNNLFNKKKENEKYGFLKNMDISRACARTPSLKNFLNHLYKELDLDNEYLEMSFSRSMDRDIFVNLVKEVVPNETILFRTLDGEVYSAQQLENEIKNGTEIGRQYTSDILRIARDLLKRRAERGGE